MQETPMGNTTPAVPQIASFGTSPLLSLPRRFVMAANYDSAAIVVTE
jgi:hypothetical protein